MGKQLKTYELIKYDWTTLGFNEIEVSSGEDVSKKVQAGDILVRKGNGSSNHVTFIASVKNGRIRAYDCGNPDNVAHGTNLKGVDLGGYFVNGSGFKGGKIIRATK